MLLDEVIKDLIRYREGIVDIDGEDAAQKAHLVVMNSTGKSAADICVSQFKIRSVKFSNTSGEPIGTRTPRILTSLKQCQIRIELPGFRPST